MIGILTKNKAFVAQTISPLLIEPLAVYENTPALIPNKYLSITKKYYFNEQDELTEKIEAYLPIFPNEEVIDQSNGNTKLTFAVRKELLKSFTTGTHLCALVERISKNASVNANNCTWLLLIQDHAIVFSKKNSKLVFQQIFIYQIVEELLYYVNKIYIDLQYDTGTDYLVMLGEAQKKQMIYSVFQQYFRNIIVEDYNPLILAS